VRWNAISNLLGLAGAGVGGILGYFAFGWIIRAGFYGPFVPAGLLGLGCATLSAHRSTLRGVVCGIAGILLGVYSEWTYFPFRADDTLGYFIKHVHTLPPLKLLLIGLGGVLAFWLGRDYFDVAHFSSRWKPAPNEKRV
jgi:hypothetical protein